MFYATLYFLFSGIQRRSKKVVSIHYFLLSSANYFFKKREMGHTLKVTGVLSGLSHCLEPYINFYKIYKYSTIKYIMCNNWQNDIHCANLGHFAHYSKKIVLGTTNLNILKQLKSNSSEQKYVTNMGGTCLFNL